MNWGAPDQGGSVIEVLSGLSDLLTYGLVGLATWVFSYFRRLRERIEKLESSHVDKAEIGKRLDEIERDVETVKRVLFAIALKLDVPAEALNR